MEAKDYVKIIFKNDSNQKAEITITVQQLLDNTLDDFYEWLDDSEPCTSASCHNESQNFCDCGSQFEGYEFYKIETI